MGIARFQLEELLASVGKTYKSIDLRVASIREQRGWWNVFALIRFSHLSPELLQASRDSGAPSTLRARHFRIDSSVLPFIAWKQIRRAMAKGRLRVGDLSVRLKEPVDLSSIPPCSLSQSGQVAGPTEDHRWPALEIAHGQNPGPKLYQEMMQREASSLGYDGLWEAIAFYCRANVSSNSSHGHDLYISCPVFAVATDTAFCPLRKELTICGHADSALDGLRAAVVVHRRSAGYEDKSRFDCPLDVVPTPDSGLTTTRGTVSIPDLNLDDRVEIRLTHPELGELSRIGASALDLFPEAQVNPLYFALRAFCPEPEIQGLLLEPSTQSKRMLGPSDAFEHHAAWLLSLFGFAPIVLGNYERLHAPGTKIERGSVDVLAASSDRKTLLVVACTLSGARLNEKATNTLNVAEILRVETLQGTQVEILPVVLSAAADAPLRLHGVPIIDTSRLRDLLSIADKGDEQYLLSLLRTLSMEAPDTLFPEI